MRVWVVGCGREGVDVRVRVRAQVGTQRVRAWVGPRGWAPGVGPAANGPQLLRMPCPMPSLPPLFPQDAGTSYLRTPFST